MQATCDQDQLEPVLRREAARRGADVRFGTVLVEFHQDADAVHAIVRDNPTGTRYAIRASYLVAADGVRSPVREALGIGDEQLSILDLFGRDLVLCHDTTADDPVSILQTAISGLLEGKEQR